MSRESSAAASSGSLTAAARGPSWAQTGWSEPGTTAACYGGGDAGRGRDDGGAHGRHGHARGDRRPCARSDGARGGDGLLHDGGHYHDGLDDARAASRPSPAAFRARSSAATSSLPLAP